MFEQIRTYIYGRGSRSSDATARRADGGFVASDRQARFLVDAMDPESPRLGDCFDDPNKAAIGTQHVERQFELGSDELRMLIDEYEAAGISQSEFIATQGLVTESLVEGAFDQLRDELGADAQAAIDSVEAELREGLETTQSVSQTGIDAFTESAADSGSDGRLDYHDVLQHIGTPLFVLDTNGDIRSWNSSIERLTGVSEADAKEMEMASMAFYPDGRRGKTLADKVLDAPETTHTKYDVPKVEDEDFTLYRDTSVMADQYGDERSISFSAAPIYDDDGELIAVVEMVQDRTDEANRHEAVTSLVDEVKSTMAALKSGRLDARASFDRTDGGEYVDDQLYEVVGSLNDMAEQVEQLADQVDEQAQQLAVTIEQANSSAEAVESRVAEQTDSLTQAADNIQDIGAGMEEVAATSSEVASAAQRAKAAAEDGSDAGEAVMDVTDGLAETSEDLVDTVTALDDQMDEVSEIVEIIADVAEQTNMLALNANIEAARAGESGSGFAVVADEVKTLANETSEYASEISTSITTIQDQADETASMVETTHEQVEHAESEITEALDSLDEISDAVEEATRGIQEVADANDDQASAIENVTSMVEDAQNHAQEAEAATKEIVKATDRQEDAVTELTDRVGELTDTN
ncbi:PAS domain-containing protein [Haloarcula sp. CBA1130]|uniref:methyl-accepting chemotaxis protein n=1 Tax=unclassified Haloarcula TaxID=2624677 RepID=UPI001246392C|nr:MULTISPECIES: methyl-accepting chemotaxis protein [unclassified Haloarcula]KAA9399979.1 PAS domain-containing protein [Haloarcula sp. CBA1129]KAA9404017.1 PAS domain-containing protein [Haloarcula sp. CBA1130]